MNTVKNKTKIWYVYIQTDNEILYWNNLPTWKTSITEASMFNSEQDALLCMTNSAHNFEYLPWNIASFDKRPLLKDEDDTSE